MENKRTFGLIGRNIHYSFSKKYFTNKFESQNLQNHSYENFDIQSIKEFPNVLKTDNISGLNVTIPYKQEIIPYLDKLSKRAIKIGAVNTVKISKSRKTTGYNSDWFGFYKSIKPLVESQHTHALVLGTGGASQAVLYALKKLNIKVAIVSRNKTRLGYQYQQLNKEILDTYKVVINCTPLGTSPNIDHCPDIPYEFVTKQHLFYDLIYNPEETLFLKKAKEKGAIIKNGYEMLILQAEKSWEIWNKKKSL